MGTARDPVVGSGCNHGERQMFLVAKSFYSPYKAPCLALCSVMFRSSAFASQPRRGMSFVVARVRRYWSMLILYSVRCS